MKKFVFSLALLSALVSCVGLEQYPTNSYTDENFWNYEANVDAALNLGYSQCWNDNLYWYNNLLSDDVYGSRHSGDWLSVATGMANTRNGRFSGEWNGCYQELRTLHTALDNLHRMKVSEEKKARYEAEWRLMRAFTYLRLITWFGDVPFFTTNPTNAETLVARRTSADGVIRPFILGELEFAAQRLPKNTQIPAVENGRYTCGTAVALKARVHLLNNDWDGCIEECERLMSGNFGTYDLEADFAELFLTGHYGKESIMTIEFACDGGVEKIVRGWGLGNYVPQSIGSGGVVAFSPTQELVDCFRKLDGSEAAKADYNDRDRRFQATLAYNGCRIQVPAIINARVKVDAQGYYTCWTRKEDADNARSNDPALMDDYNGSQDRTATGYYSLKNYAPETIGVGRNSCKPLMEYRYADILLTYAEALFEKNGTLTDDQWNKTVRRLRERAGFSGAYLNKPADADLREAIRNERRCELALEGRRCYDVRRWALLADPSLKETGNAYLTTTATGAPFMEGGAQIFCDNPYGIKYWFPIPAGECEQNEYLRNSQNPGWN